VASARTQQEGHLQFAERILIFVHNLKTSSSLLRKELVGKFKRVYQPARLFWSRWWGTVVDPEACVEQPDDPQLGRRPSPPAKH
jgi:hypothetical protein